MKSVKYEDLLLADFVAEVKKTPIVYVPCGLLEWHSSHLPLGIDGLKIEALACRIAAKFGGIVMPPVYVGAPGFTSFQGTLTYRPATVRQVFFETFEQLAKVGFRVIVAIGGHYGPPQQESLESAAAEFKLRTDLAIWVLNEADVVRDLGIVGDHAGPWETAMGIELCGDRVELERFTPGSQPVVRYNVPQRPDGFDFEYGTWDFVIEQDLRTVLGRDRIREQVAIVVQRIGEHPQELLQRVRAIRPDTAAG